MKIKKIVEKHEFLYNLRPHKMRGLFYFVTYFNAFLRAAFVLGP